MFELIKSIKTSDESTWKDKLFLTFDIDWAHDDIILDCLDLVLSYNLKSTWFVTHETELLQKMSNDSRIELGLHPNFNFLLNGSSEVCKNAKEVVGNLIKIVPNAKSVRSHSITYNGVVQNIFIDFGLTHDCNCFIPIDSKIELKPWKLWNGLCRIPYMWEDDVHILFESSGFPQNTITEIVENSKGIKVFDFHPIHIFLNSESLDRYEKTRSLHKDPKELIKYRFEGYGARNQLIELLKLSRGS